MRALKMVAWESDPVLVDMPVPEPGPGQVLLKVEAAGCCHSDLHLFREPLQQRLTYGPPFVVGHESAGRAHALGPGVSGIDLGASYVVYGPTGCGICPPCREGVETYCERGNRGPAALGLGLDGGMAEYMLVSDRHLVPIGDLDPAIAAPLADAGLTPYHAIRRALPDLGANSVALAIGLGGLGGLGVQILKGITGATVIGVDTRQAALDIGRASGADHVLLADADVDQAIADITRGRGCTAIFDFVGATSTIELGIRSARHRSSLTVVGIEGSPIQWSTSRGIPSEMNLSTTYWGSLPELHDVIDLAHAGILRPVIERFSLDDALTAYAKLERGEVVGRAVVIP